MAKVLINFHAVDWIHDCSLYSRQLSPVFFDEGGITINLLFTVGRFEVSDLPSKVKQVVIESPRIMENEECFSFSKNDGHSKQIFRHPLCEPTFVEEEIEEIFRPSQLTFCVIPERKCELLMNAHLASCVSAELKRCRKFRRRFLKYISRHYGFCAHEEDYEKMDFTALQRCEFLTVLYMVDVTTIWPKQKIDYHWNIHIQNLVDKRRLLAEVMAWLSTLGGAYSALGDFFKEHAFEAGKLSKRQLQIAQELGDPIEAAKCQIFWALSLLQQGFYKQCQAIVRKQYSFAVNSVVQDTKLINMCKAVWSRLQYVYKLKKLKKLRLTSHKLL